jgi:hypothetical protein
MSHASVQALVCGQKVMRYGHILSSSLAKRLNKKVRLGVILTIPFEQALDISRDNGNGISITERLRGRNSREKK